MVAAEQDKHLTERTAISRLSARVDQRTYRLKKRIIVKFTFTVGNFSGNYCNALITC